MQVIVPNAVFEIPGHPIVNDDQKRLRTTWICNKVVRVTTWNFLLPRLTNTNPTITQTTIYKTLHTIRTRVIWTTGFQSGRRNMKKTDAFSIFVSVLSPDIRQFKTWMIINWCGGHTRGALEVIRNKTIVVMNIFSPRYQFI